MTVLETILPDKTYKTLLELLFNCVDRKDENSITQLFNGIQNMVDFEYAVVGNFEILNPKTGVITKRIVNHSYNKEWMKTYVQENYINIDPVISVGMKSSDPFVWGSETVENYNKNEDGIKNPKNKNVVQFFSAAHDFGLKSGVSYVYKKLDFYGHSPTVISLANVKAENIPMAAKVIKYTSPILSDTLLSNISKSNVQLGKRETEVLKWIMAGKSAWETGIIMSISERTVRHHLTNIYKKLDVVNSTQAVAEAIRSGII